MAKIKADLEKPGSSGAIIDSRLKPDAAALAVRGSYREILGN
jgi:hypothetical protein